MHYARSGEVECVSTHTRTFQKLRRKYWSRTLRVVCRQPICRLVSGAESQFIDKLAEQLWACGSKQVARVWERLERVWAKVWQTSFDAKVICLSRLRKKREHRISHAWDGRTFASTPSIIQAFDIGDHQHAADLVASVCYPQSSGAIFSHHNEKV